MVVISQEGVFIKSSSKDFDTRNIKFLELSYLIQVFSSGLMPIEYHWTELSFYESCNE